MFLKHIEVQGFKSFPDKTVINFDRGITAIVGPNGSGKSNIVDAIRWVLGEQSTKTLRGGKMEDVIFGGTKRRNAVGFCEVTMTLDNSDRTLPPEFDEISVTRRYYRSGESEFFINRKSVRLKDIHELFMDTGLGRDGYAIIGQGRIAEILSAKSTDRREIFEEAAGIARFRYRKEECERKLSGCEDNLVRVRDIITELETQIEPLAKQAEKAKSFLIFRDELRTLEVTVWLDSLEKLKDNLQKAQVDFDNAERMLSARKSELSELHERSEQLGEQMHALDGQSETLREQLRSVEHNAAEVQSAIAVLETNIKNNQENILSKTKELDEEQSRGDTLQSQLSARRARISELDELALDVSQKTDRLAQRISEAATQARGIGEQIDALSAASQLELQRATEVAGEISATKSGISEIELRGETVKSELTSLSQRLSSEQQTASEIDADIEQQCERRDSAQNMLKGHELRSNARAAKFEDMKKKHADNVRTLELRSEKLSLLEAMERDYEGFSGAVKRIMQAVKQNVLKGVHGPVAELIKTEDRYSAAIETALGAAVQNIVVNAENDAKSAISYLKSKDLGRATFLPITSVKPRTRPKNDPRHDGFLGWADGLIKYDSAYERVINSLLSTTAVADTIDSAIAIAKQAGYSFRIVTLDGQLINPSGAMTGGSLAKSIGVLSRANEIERLKAEISQLGTAISEGATTLKSAERELNEVNYLAKQASDELRSASDELLELGARKTQHSALLEALLAQHASLESERAEQSSKISAAQQQITRLSGLEQEHRSKAEQLAAQHDQLVKGRREDDDLAASLTENMTTLRSEAAAIKAEHEATQAALSELVTLVSSMEGQFESKAATIAAIEARNKELAQQITAQRQSYDEHIQHTERISASLRDIGQQRLTLEGARATCDRETQAKNNDLLNLERERGRLENKKNQAEMEEDSIIQKLWDNYELTRVTAKDVCIPLENTAQAGRRIGELKGSIKRLGDVNVGAIEEYAKLSERFEFLSTQRTDLESARDDLLKIISDLTGNMEDIFAEHFKLINDAFQTTFSEIFRGGGAYLRLEDESDILNCGIEIKVELPGKSMRAISLLSGGEQALVASALYFAIIKVRPTPFCVLDEIEAALDDVNVTVFIEYVRTLCHATQFILITHRRGTMEGSDILYGVTMQEQGITKLLVLNINEVEEKLDLSAV